MCGITGYAGRELPGLLEKMNTAIAHRGPDGEGYFNTDSIHFAHRRLAIIDIATGSQPMHNQHQNLTVVFNGEIYNHRELRKTLEDKGHKFITDHSDTEVLLHGYSEWRERLPEFLNGMWAFAIYDHQTRKIFLSRDRFGQKPLYYSLCGDYFVFASELSSLTLHPEISRNISTLSLQKFFAYGFIPHPHTIYENIYKLPGGYNLSYSLDEHTVSLKKYWSYQLAPDYSLTTKDTASIAEEVKSLLQRAVKRRLQADVEPGILLSGGIDSSAIAVLAADKAENIRTFSIGFNEASYDESAFSSKIANLIGSNHTLQRLNIDDTTAELPYLLKNLDEPQGDDSLLPTYLVCRLAREKVKFALGGDGGDELFYGYEPFRFWRWARRFNIYLPKITHQAVKYLVNMLPASNQYMALSLKLKRFFHASSLNMKVWTPALLAPLTSADITELTHSEVSLEDLYSEAIACWDNCSSTWVGDRINQYYIEYYLQDEILAKTDRASMLNSLELRAPFLDVELADFARKLPHQLKIRMGTTKYILKEAMRGLLPEDILYRKKQGFSPPTSDWFLNGKLSVNTCATDMINPETVRRLAQTHKQKSDDNRLFLWNQYAFESFLQANKLCD